MIFLPGSCEVCAAMQLISGADCIDNKSLCSACGGLIFVISGWAFPEGDVPLFDALCGAIEKSSLPAAECAHLAMALADSATSHGELATLELAAFWIPNFAPVRSMLASNPARARQAISMLDLILGERGKTRDSVIRRRDLRSVVGQ